MAGMGFEAHGLDLSLVPERNNFLFEDNHSEGWRDLDEGVSVSMLWTGG